jgi:mannosylglycerate hydrolase
MEQDHFMLETPKKWGVEIITQDLIDELWETTADSVIENHRLMMNGCDYTAYQNMMPELIDYLNKNDKKKRKWVQTSMAEFVKIMNQKINRKKLKVVEGELRDGPAIRMTANALSSRLYLKILNKKAQNMLIRFAEPMANLAALQGVKFPGHFMKSAWRLLLESHPHDSINGVTQDKTADDNEDRLNQVVDIANTVMEKSMRSLIVKIDMRKFKDDDVLITVFNPLPYSCGRVIEAWVNMPKNFPEQNGLQIYDAKGKAIDTQWEGMEERLYCVAEIHTRTRPFYCNRHRLFFKTGTIPAGGYKVFRVGKIEPDKGKAIWNDIDVKPEIRLIKEPNVMENEFLRVEFNSNGTFNLTDKTTKKTLGNLNYFEDRGEMGTYWVNRRPMYDKVFNSLACKAKIWSEENGALQTTIVSEVTMTIPDRAIPEQQRRGDKELDLIIKTSVTLRAGEKQVEVNVEFENRHQDHCLRAMFPTGISNAKFSNAGGHFIVDKRPVKPMRGPAAGTVWPDMATLPMNNFVDVSDNKSGIAFLTNSLTEFEVLETTARTVALTLVRSCKNWIPTERVGTDYPSQKGGQCFGYHKLSYAIMPHKGDWQAANIPLAAEQFNMPPLPVQTSAHKGELPGTEKSLFEISNPALRFSALKKTEDKDTITVRIYNPTNTLQKGNLIFANKIKKAWLTDLNEKRGKEIKLTSKNKIPVSAKSNKIVTVEIQFIKIL